jgi:nitroreductase
MIDVIEAMRTNGTARYFRPDGVPDDVLLAAIEAARFGPSGGNRQPVRWIIVRDPVLKAALADLYRPLSDRDIQALRTGELTVGNKLDQMIAVATDFASGLREIPVILVACAILSGMHKHMMRPDGPNMIAGSSVYPVVQNMCLALRAHGVASALTTLLCEREEEVAKLLDLPEGVVCACHLAVGYPARPFPTRLTRLPVTDLVFYDRYGNHREADG